MSKKCLDCGTAYVIDDKRCPKCGSTNFVGGMSSSDDIAKLFAQMDSESRKITNQAIRAANAGKYDEAISLGQRAIEIDPNEAHAYAAVGMSLAQKGSFADAIHNLETALRLDSSLDQARDFLRSLPPATQSYQGSKAWWQFWK